jgi:hypothetical protein
MCACLISTHSGLFGYVEVPAETLDFDKNSLDNVDGAEVILDCEFVPLAMSGVL